MSSTDQRMQAFACAAIVLACHAYTAASHGYMNTPLSRPLKSHLKQVDWALWGDETTPQQIWNGGFNPPTAAGLTWPERPAGQICGYGSTGTNMTRWRVPGAVVATFTAGADLPIVSCFTARHMGRIEAYVCPNSATSLAQCTQLTRSDIPSHFAYIDGLAITGSCTSGPGGQRLDTTWKIPATLSCPSCTLVWLYVTANSCVLPCPATDPQYSTHCTGTMAVCGSSPSAYPEEFYSCADISITPSNTSPTPAAQSPATPPPASPQAPSPTPSPTQTPTPSPTPTTSGTCTAADAVTYCTANPAVAYAGVVSTGCASFYQCAGTASQCKACPTGLVFNAALSACDWLYNVNTATCNAATPATSPKSSPTPSPAASPLPSPKPSPIPSPASASPIPSPKPSPTPSPVPSPTPTPSPSPSPSPTSSPTPSPVPSPTPSPTPSPSPTSSPTPSPAAGGPGGCSAAEAAAFCTANPSVTFIGLPATACASFYQCAGAASACQTCQTGLAFNTVAKACDWPRNLDTSTCNPISTRPSSPISPASPSSPKPSPSPSSPAPSPSPVPPGSSYSVTYSQFSCIFLNDHDIYGNTNAKAAVDRHWSHFNTALTARGKAFGNAIEAAVFLGHIKHEYGGYLDYMVEYCARAEETCGCCDSYSGSWCGDVVPAGKQYFGRGPIQLSWPCNYKVMGEKLGADILNNPALVSDPNQNIGWQTAVGFWTIPDFNCKGQCPSEAAAGLFGATTKRINPIECDVNGSRNPSQTGRVGKYQAVRACLGQPQETNTAVLYC